MLERAVLFGFPICDLKTRVNGKQDFIKTHVLCRAEWVEVDCLVPDNSVPMMSVAIVGECKGRRQPLVENS